MPKYEIIEGLTGRTIKRENEDGTASFFSEDPANSDYQAYLRSLEAAQSTPIVTEDE
jgi:hypothetical protein